MEDSVDADVSVVVLLVAVLVLASLVLWERVSRVRECRELRREAASLLRIHREMQDGLLDRLLEKEVMQKVAKGIPVPERILRGPEPTPPEPAPSGNGAPDNETIVMDDEAEAFIEHHRKQGWTDDRIARELLQLQRSR